MEKSNSSSAGIGLPGLVFLVFLVLKLTNVIDWSWWWVTAPLWGIVALWLFFVLLGLMLGTIRFLVSTFKHSK